MRQSKTMAISALICLLIILPAVGETAAPTAPSLADIRLPALTPEMVLYSRTRYALYFVSVLYGLAIFFAIMQTGLSTRLRQISERMSKLFPVQIAIYSVVLSVLIALLAFPLSFYSGFWLEHSFHLSSQTFLDWLADDGKGLLVSMFVTMIGFTTLFTVIHRFPRHWPILLWLILVPYFAFSIFAEPLIVDPLFNKFSVMQPGSLKTHIFDLANRANIVNANILVADKNKQTNKLNAYVTGLGGSSRIVLWDNTIANLPEDQTLAVVGHEIGHYVLGHVYWDFMLICAISFLSVPINYLFAAKFVASLPKRWQLRGMDDYALAPVLLAVSVMAGFLLLPAINAWSRYQEHQADEFGLRLTDNRLAMANLFISLSIKNLSEPDPPPLIKFWLYTHPTLRERIEFAVGHSIK